MKVSLIILSPNFKLLESQFTNATSEGNINPDSDNVAKYKYYDTEELQKIKIPNKDKSMSLFCMNACPLKKDLVHFQHFLSSKKKEENKIK